MDFYYRFTDCRGRAFDMPFENADKAADFAYKCGYCFCGRTADQKKSYFQRKSAENIKRMTENKEA